jgi:hypothetical protein
MLKEFSDRVDRSSFEAKNLECALPFKLSSPVQEPLFLIIEVLVKSFAQESSHGESMPPGSNKSEESTSPSRPISSTLPGAFEFSESEFRRF